MRYYIYLDKDFLKSLFASIGESDFDIGIMEFYTQKSYSTTQDVGTTPCVEREFERNCDEDRVTNYGKFGEDEAKDEDNTYTRFR